MKIVCIGYREWALNVYFKLQKNSPHDVVIIKQEEIIDFDLLEALNPDFVLFYGWSWKVPTEVFSSYCCLMLHPSNLPMYRGGSPIQNQILDGVTDTKITIFQITDKMDAGPILVQRPLNLRGELSDILKRIETVGYEATIDILEDNYELTHQNNDQATYCKRRRPSQSEITLDELQTSSALEIYNKVRCLQDPYPNAFLRLPDGSVLYLKSVSCDV